jgi:hypothetical protein
MPRFKKEQSYPLPGAFMACYSESLTDKNMSQTTTLLCWQKILVSEISEYVIITQVQSAPEMSYQAHLGHYSIPLYKGVMNQPMSKHLQQH